MWALSTVASEVIRNSHSVDLRASIFGPAGQEYDNLQISGGTVTDDSTSQTRRSATVYVNNLDLWPSGATDALSPAGAEMLIEYGIVIPGGGTEWVPLIRGVVVNDDETLPVSQQGITVTLADRSQHVIDDRLAQPLQVGGTSTVVATIEQLIRNAYPSAEIIDQTGDTTTCPLYTVQQDLWADGVEPLATSIGAEVFCDQAGRFIVRYQPTLNDPPTWIVDTGPRGVLVSNDRVRDRSNVFNQVIATGESSTGAPAVTATATDTDPTSPTYFYGSFGQKPRFYVSSTIATVSQAQAAANAILARAKGLDTVVTLNTVQHPGLQSGDVIELRGLTGDALHIIDSVTFPLDFQQTQQIISRATVLPAEQDGGIPLGPIVAA